MAATAAPQAESENQLLHRAQQAVSQCNWEVGECAAVWTKRFSRGRTDGDFAALVGLTADQVYQRRRVWETFGDVQSHYGQLKWSHFYAALTWEDAAECLQWAHDIGSTVAEMKAWRRAQRGEDLSTAADDETFGWLPVEPSEVRIPRPEGGDGSASGGSPSRERDSSAVPVASGVARESAPGAGDEYAPFSPNAMTPPAAPAAERPRPAPTIEQLVRRLTTTLERCAAAMNSEFRDEFANVPEKDRKRFFKAATAMADKIAELG